MIRKHWQSIYNTKLHGNLTEEYVIQFKSGIIINVNVSIKNIIYVKKIGKNGKYLANIMDDLIVII